MPTWLRKKAYANPDELYPSDRFAYKTNAADPIYIPVNRIQTPYQTEDALDESKVKANLAAIKKGKALEPVVIGYKYDLHDGHHRLEASKRAGHTHVPCIVGGRNERRVKAAEKRYRRVWKSTSNLVVSDGRLLIKSGLSTVLRHRVMRGDAHWVTVTEGPLEGRHLLIDGPRPADGKRSRGKILAGTGIPPHVIEKITGATKGHEIPHARDEDAHIHSAMSHSDKLNGIGPVAQAAVRSKVKEQFGKGAHRVAIVHTGRYVYSIPYASGSADKTDAEIAKDVFRKYAKRGHEVTIVHKFGSDDEGDTSVFNSSGKQLNAGVEKEKREKRRKQAAQLLVKLVKFGVDGVEFNKESETEKDRQRITEATQNAFGVLSKTAPLGAMKKTSVKLVLGKLAAGSKAWAHYTPSQKSIYMTSKKNGMKPFFHEYGHALDHAVSRYSGYASDNGILVPLIDAIRKTKSHQDFIDGIGKPGTRWSSLDANSGLFGKRYFRSPRETFARFFAEYTLYKAEQSDVEVPEELREPKRFERYSDAEMEKLAKVFEDIMKKHGLEKAIQLDDGGRVLIKAGLSSALRAKVKSGEAHWVTVKEGPLEGRHLLIAGPRPASGKKSRGQILAGHGIPRHVVEKITGATHAHQLDHQVYEGPNGSDKDTSGGADTDAKKRSSFSRHSAATSKRLKSIEDSIRNNKTESGHVVDNNGNVVWKNQGGADYVDVRDAVENGHLKGNTFTHNHPRDTSFSPQDISILLGHGMKEMRAVGRRNTHIARPPVNFRGTRAELQKIEDSLNKHHEAVVAEFTSAIRSGKISRDEAEAEHFHQVWTRVAKDTGLRYERRIHGEEARSRSKKHDAGQGSRQTDLRKRQQREVGKRKVIVAVGRGSHERPSFCMRDSSQSIVVRR